MTTTKHKKKQEVELCPCGKGLLLEGWVCCEACRVNHFRWPLPADVLAAGTKGVVVDYGRVQLAMTGKRCAAIEINIAVDPARHPDQVFFAWRPRRRPKVRMVLGAAVKTKNPWRPLGSHVEATYRDLPASVDTGAYHWWSQTLAWAIDEQVDLDPHGA